MAAPTQTRPRRLWLLALVLALVAFGAWFSAQHHAKATGEVVDLGIGRPKLLEFGMGICEQCKRLKPVVEQAARELGDRVEVHVFDVRQESNERLGERFKMISIPLVVLVDGSGREVWRHEGFIDFPELSQAVFQHLVPSSGDGASGRREASHEVR
jgi:thioredoxin 1